MLVRRWLPQLALGVFALGLLAWFYLPFLESGMRAIPGDRGDSRMVLAFLERWYAVLQGRVGLSESLFFFPAPGILGYTDTWFLYLPLYSFWRLWGCDWFLSFGLLLVTLTMVGFLGMWFFLQRTIGLGYFFSILGAATFATLNGFAQKMNHSQMFALHLLPWFGVGLGWLLRQPRAAREVKGIWLGLFLGSLFLTSFYTGFFLLLFCLLAFLLAPARWGRFKTEVRGRFLWPLIGFGVMGIPFVLLYGHAFLQGSGRHFGEVMSQAPTLLDVLNVGSNSLWGAVGEWAGSFSFGASGGQLIWERQTGFTPVLLLAFLMASFSLIRTHSAAVRWPRQMALVAIVAWLLSVRWYWKFSLWALVFLFFPGSHAVRSLGRIQLALGLLVVPVGFWGLHKLYLLAKQQEGWRRTAGILGSALLALWIPLEQHNGGKTFGLDRESEWSLIQSFAPPAKECRSIYLTPSGSASAEDPSAFNATSMLLAVRFGLPTLNGLSGLDPKGWDLVPGPGYQASVQSWIRVHRLEGVCAVASH